MQETMEKFDRHHELYSPLMITHLNQVHEANTSFAKTLFLMNGGALIAMLSFLGTKKNIEFNALTAGSVSCGIIGLTVACICFGIIQRATTLSHEVNELNMRALRLLRASDGKHREPVEDIQIGMDKVKKLESLLLRFGTYSCLAFLLSALFFVISLA